MIRVFLIFLFLNCSGFVVYAQKPMFPKPLSPRIANYTIDVKLDADKKQLSGREILQWRNDSNDQIHDLRFHMYLNAFKNEQTTFFRESAGSSRGADIDDEHQWGWTTITKLVRDDTTDLSANMTYIQPDDGNPMDETVLQVLLDKPIAPGESVKLNIEFTAQLPRIVARTGFVGDFVLAGQWFPKIGVYENDPDSYAKSGQWNCHQFHSNSEFYADFGVYDVRINVPADYTVGATGVLLNRSMTENDRQVWHFYCEDVHDFAWTADTDVIVVEDRWEDVEIRYLVQPLRDGAARRQIEAAKNAMEFCRDWYGVYPYPTLTIVDPQFRGLDAGGMEYPTFITGAMSWLFPEGIRLPEETIVHEFAHNYWQGMVASNEFEEAWLDEGLTTYSELKMMDMFYSKNAGSSVDILGLEIDNNQTLWASYSSRPQRDKIIQFSWQYERGGYGALSYSKPAIFLYTLENYLGQEKMKQIMRTYFTRYKFKHPRTADFIQTVNELSENTLSRFLEQVLYSTGVLDYAIDRISIKRIREKEQGIFGNPLVIEDSLKTVMDSTNDVDQDSSAEEQESRMYESKVIVERKGEVRLPVEFQIKFDDGNEVNELWDGEERFKVYTYVKSSKVISAQVDPQRKIWLDVNFLNNSQSLKSNRAASLKYSTRWLFWMQNMLTILSVFS